MSTVEVTIRLKEDGEWRTADSFSVPGNKETYRDLRSRVKQAFKEQQEIA
jgi:hypothetical protein